MIKALEDKWYVDDLRINVDRKDVFLTIPLQNKHGKRKSAVSGGN